MTKKEKLEARKFIDRVNKLPRTIEALNSLNIERVMQVLSCQPPEVAQQLWEPVAQLMLDIADAPENPSLKSWKNGGTAK